MNWASSSIGATIVGVSSEVKGCEAQHILSNELSQIWLSEPGLPQWLCVSLLSLNISDLHSVEIRTIGWHCWHSYSTNPREVRLHVSRDGAKFRIWDTLIASSHIEGTQLFCCAPISAILYPYVAIEILSTFGGSQTYINQLFLYSDEISQTSIILSDDEANTDTGAVNATIMKQRKTRKSESKYEVIYDRQNNFDFPLLASIDKSDRKSSQSYGFYDDHDSDVSVDSLSKESFNYDNTEVAVRNSSTDIVNRAYALAERTQSIEDNLSYKMTQSPGYSRNDRSGTGSLNTTFLVDQFEAALGILDSNDEFEEDHLLDIHKDDHFGAEALNEREFLGAQSISHCVDHTLQELKYNEDKIESMILKDDKNKINSVNSQAEMCLDGYESRGDVQAKESISHREMGQERKGMEVETLGSYLAQYNSKISASDEAYIRAIIDMTRTDSSMESTVDDDDDDLSLPVTQHEPLVVAPPPNLPAKDADSISLGSSVIFEPSNKQSIAMNVIRDSTMDIDLTARLNELEDKFVKMATALGSLGASSPSDNPAPSIESREDAPMTVESLSSAAANVSQAKGTARSIETEIAQRGSSYTRRFRPTRTRKTRRGFRRQASSTSQSHSRSASPSHKGSPVAVENVIPVGPGDEPVHIRHTVSSAAKIRRSVSPSARTPFSVLPPRSENVEKLLQDILHDLRQNGQINSSSYLEKLSSHDNGVETLLHCQYCGAAETSTSSGMHGSSSDVHLKVNNSSMKQSLLHQCSTRDAHRSLDLLQNRQSIGNILQEQYENILYSSHTSAMKSSIKPTVAQFATENSNEDMDSLISQLHFCVLQRTLKEAQLRAIQNKNNEL